MTSAWYNYLRAPVVAEQGCLRLFKAFSLSPCVIPFWASTSLSSESFCKRKACKQGNLSNPRSSVVWKQWVSPFIRTQKAALVSPAHMALPCIVLVHETCLCTNTLTFQQNLTSKFMMLKPNASVYLLQESVAHLHTSALLLVKNLEKADFWFPGAKLTFCFPSCSRKQLKILRHRLEIMEIFGSFKNYL